MTENKKIYRKDSSLLIEIPVTDSCVYKRTLMEEHHVMLVFDLERYIDFERGCYIEHEGRRFEIMSNVYPDYDNATGAWKYSIQFEAPEGHLRRFTIFYRHLIGESEKMTEEVVFAVTEPLAGFGKLVIDCINHELGVGNWELAQIPEKYTLKALPLSFKGEKLFDALTLIAEAFDCEWWTESVNDRVVLHFGKLETGMPVDFKAGHFIQSMPRRDSDSAEYGTRFFCFGSTRNLSSEYRENDTSGIQNYLSEIRLRLPEGIDYIDAKENMEPEEIVQQVVFFDDIYPKNEDTVTSTDSEGPKLDDNKVSYHIYKFSASGTSFEPAHLIAGDKLRCHFTSGALSGREFELQYGSPYQKNFTIIPVTESLGDSHFYIPNENSKPNAGDTFILTGVQLSDDRVKAAEEQLRIAGEDHAKKFNSDTGIYDCPTNPVYTIGGKQVEYDLGQKVTLIDPTRFGSQGRSSRIQGFEKKLWNHYDAVYTVGDNTTYSRLASIEQNIKEAEYASRIGVIKGGGTYVIGVGDYTQPTNFNVYSATRTVADFAKKNGSKDEDFAARRLTSQTLVVPGEATFLGTGQVALTQSPNGFDVEPPEWELGTYDHNKLENRNLPDQHSTAAITGLDNKLSQIENKFPAYLQRAGGTMEGNIALSIKSSVVNAAGNNLVDGTSQTTLGNTAAAATIASNATDLVHKRPDGEFAIWDKANFTPSDYVKKTGDTMSGQLTVPSVSVSGTVSAATAAVSGTVSAAKVVASTLTVPQSAPSVGAGEVALMASPNGFDAETPPGGGLSGDYLPLAGGTLTGNLLMKNTAYIGDEGGGLLLRHLNGRTVLGNTIRPVSVYTNDTDIIHQRENGAYAVWDEYNQPVSIDNEPSTLVKRNHHGYVQSKIYQDLWPVEAMEISHIMYMYNSDGFHRHCTPDWFRSQVTDNRYQPTIGIESLRIDSGQHYIILAPVYTDEQLPETVLIGTFTARRGAAGNSNRKLAAQVVCGSAYRTHTASCFSMGEKSTIVSCTYQGKKYLALKFGNSGSDIFDFQFSGRHANSAQDPNIMKDVYATDLTNIVETGENVYIGEIWTHANFDPNSKVNVTDSRLTDARKANGGNADTVGGIAPAAVGTIQAGKLASYNQNGHLWATALRDELPLNDAININAIAYRTETDNYLRYCSLNRFRSQVTDNYYFKHQKGIAESDMDNIAHYDKSGTFGISRGGYGAHLINFVASGTSTSPVQLYVDHYSTAGRSLSWRNGIDNNRITEPAWRKIWDSALLPDPARKSVNNAFTTSQSITGNLVATGTVQGGQLAIPTAAPTSLETGKVYLYVK